MTSHQTHVAQRRPVEGRLKLGEKLGCGVGEGVRAQRRQRQFVDAIQSAPQRGFDDQERIAAGQIHRLVRSRRIGHANARHAPMILVDVGQRQVERHERLQAGAGHRRQKTAQRTLLGALPEQAGTDIERLHAQTLGQHLRQHDRAIQSAAEQQAKRALAIRERQVERH
jgi:hypothetical protein